MNNTQTPQLMVDRFASFTPGGELAGVYILAMVLSIAIYRYTRLRRVENETIGRRQKKSDGELSSIVASLDFLIIPAGIFGPLFMFASLNNGFTALQNAHGELLHQDAWKNYKLCMWALFGAVSLLQLFVIKRLRFDWNQATLRIARIAVSGLPIATMLGASALEKIFFGGVKRVLDGPVFCAAIGAMLGIAIWLVYLICAAPIGARYRLAESNRQPASANDLKRTEPTKSAPARERPFAMPAAGQRKEPFMPPPPKPKPKPKINAAEDMEARLQELARLLEKEIDESDDSAERIAAAVAQQPASAPQENDVKSLSMQEQVDKQKRLFQSGMQFNFPALVNGLIILDESINLHDNIRGDTLLHAAAQAGNLKLVAKLLEHGADRAALNWAGLTAHALAKDPEIRQLLSSGQSPV